VWIARCWCRVFSGGEGSGGAWGGPQFFNAAPAAAAPQRPRWPTQAHLFPSTSTHFGSPPPHSQLPGHASSPRSPFFPSSSQAWSKCVDDHRTAGEDFAAACHPATAALQACMGEHSEYYRDFLADADALAADAALATGAGVGGEGEEEGAADGGGDDDDVAVLADPAAPASAAAAAAAEAGVAAASSLDPPPSPATAAAAAAAALVDAAVADASSSPAISLATPPGDARFPATNQARRCFTAYSEHAKCVSAGGGEGAEERCGGLARAYRSLCPSEWVEKWADQRAAGTWAGKY